MKRFLVIGIILCSIILILPTLLVLSFSNDTATEGPRAVHTTTDPQQMTPADDSGISVPVYRTQNEEVERVSLDDYVIGVVASEMPAEFEIEALKAQALAARTYIIKYMLDPGDINVPEGAIVTDTVDHQVYKNHQELQQLWGHDYDWKIARIQQAVYATQGEILTYNGEPITAAFFSTSNGYTENSEDYWPNSFPYLRSVESPWDHASPRFISETKIPVSEVEQRLSVTLPEGGVGEITERTDGGRVAKVNINGTEFNGREVREGLELDSSDFEWRREGDQVVIETKGWGHGVGMSQYGANGMAQDGRTYQEIVSHYYQGIAINEVEEYSSSLTAKAD
ncbi:stage II sporulation protein D [Desertibacillus haloalkaliphilus]|uniref:stage II sporulation protein D n=1 Tax=Desertibacillus haloalkaliphilus TaxID=1328930 RepID=UPI001C259262|nr:stage II sporulation protein D [Desertibacillus haloalkaliphilus]MBU8905906.1 stage II sporulation protein D [Desertibacillus haloalkaliphilus]